jgi:nucleoside-diphosphate-sugar epimerase
MRSLMPKVVRSRRGASYEPSHQMQTRTAVGVSTESRVGDAVLSASRRLKPGVVCGRAVPQAGILERDFVAARTPSVKLAAGARKVCLASRVKLLVLGGTAWLGREVAAHAVANGHEVSCLARGSSNGAPRGARFIRADRDRINAYDAACAERWDAIIDVSRQPGHVRRAVVALEPVARRFVFVSSGSVYASQRELSQDENAPLLPPLESDVMDSMERYGEAKVACEQAVSDMFGSSRTLIARVGLIGGPGDWSGRSGYWPWRFARTSNPQTAVLVPDAPDVPTALIDVRDLASWLISCSTADISGVFNVGGSPLPLSEHLAEAQAVAGHTGPLVHAPGDWLVDQGVQNWSGPKSLPLWLDDPDWYGMNARDMTSARSAGLVTRSLRKTLADTLAWELAQPNPGPHGAGLTDEEERQLLHSLATSHTAFR